MIGNSDKDDDTQKVLLELTAVDVRRKPPLSSNRRRLNPGMQLTPKINLGDPGGQLD